ncbi:MAG: response regulator [Pseudomonadota bacterium]
MPDYQEVEFLIVDDDDVSVTSIKRAMKQLRLLNPVRVASDGVEALEILRGEAGQDRLTPPFIVLLDLRMPRMGGHEFLEELRNDERLKQTVVFILTTSVSPDDISRAYQKNVAGYVVKAAPYESMKDTLELLDQFSRVVVLPSDKEPE